MPFSFEIHEYDPVWPDWEFTPDVAFRHKEFCGELLRLVFNDLRARLVWTVHNKVPKFMRRIKPGSVSLSLVSAERNYWPFWECHAECIHII